MKRLTIASALFLAFLMIGAAVGYAQHQMGQHQTEGQTPLGGHSGPREPHSGRQPMMGHGMMGMMCPMMSMMLDPMGMGMMSGRQLDTKTMAQVLQLRGDMLKAMGEVMLKHSKALEEAK
jgi:hypothetical protein